MTAPGFPAVQRVVRATRPGAAADDRPRGGRRRQVVRAEGHIYQAGCPPRRATAWPTRGSPSTSRTDGALAGARRRRRRVGRPRRRRLRRRELPDGGYLDDSGGRRRAADVRPASAGSRPSSGAPTVRPHARPDVPDALHRARAVPGSSTSTTRPSATTTSQRHGLPREGRGAERADPRVARERRAARRATPISGGCWAPRSTRRRCAGPLARGQDWDRPKWLAAAAAARRPARRGPHPGQAERPGPRPDRRRHADLGQPAGHRRHHAPAVPAAAAVRLALSLFRLQNIKRGFFGERGLDKCSVQVEVPRPPARLADLAPYRRPDRPSEDVPADPNYVSRAVRPDVEGAFRGGAQPLLLATDEMDVS